MDTTPLHDATGRWSIARIRAIVRVPARPVNGQALVWFAMSATILILCVAFVADTGQIWMNRRHLQNSADAAALAAVQNLPDVPSTARTTACDYAKNKNSVPDMIMDCVTPNKDIKITQTYVLNDTITVTVHKDVHLIIGGMFDWKTVSISAHAKALIGGISPSACVFPLAQTPDLLPPATSGTGIQMYTPTKMKTSSNTGQTLALQVDNTSSSSAWENVVSSPAGCNNQVVSTVTTKGNGNFSGPVNTALTNRQTLWTTQNNCTSSDPTVYDPDRDGQLWHNGIQLDLVTCYRIVKIPVLSIVSSSIGASKTYPIAHIALFYIGGWCNNPSCTVTATYTDINTGAAKSTTMTLGKSEIWGYYISLITQGGTDYHAYDGYGPKVAVLVE